MDKGNRGSEIILAFISWVLLVLGIIIPTLPIVLLPWAPATVKEADFLPTPKGTIVFLFTSVHSLQINNGKQNNGGFLAYFIELIATLSGGFFNIAMI